MRNPGPADGRQSARGYVRPAETDSTRLAHWPPTYRSRETQPVIMKHDRGEKPKRAKPRGWRLTRSLFSEFADD